MVEFKQASQCWHVSDPPATGAEQLALHGIALSSWQSDRLSGTSEASVRRTYMGGGLVDDGLYVFVCGASMSEWTDCIIQCNQVAA